MRGLRPGVRRCPRPRRSVRPAPQPPAPPVSAPADRGARLPPRGPATARRAPRRPAHPGRVPGPRGLLRLLPRPLHDTGGVGRVVLRRRHRPTLSGRLSVQVPGAPRDAVGGRLTGLAHGRRWLPHLRGPDRQAACRERPDPHRNVRTRRPPPRRRCGYHRRGRHHGVLRRRGRRRPPGPGATAAHGPDRPGAGGAGRVPLLPQHHPPAHRHPAAAARCRGPRLLEPPDAVVRVLLRPGDGQLRHEPAPTPGCHRGVRGHSRRRGPRRPRPGTGPHGLRTPRLHPRVGGSAAAASRTRR